MLTLPPLAAAWDAIVARHLGCAPDRLRRELIRDQIGDMVNDVIAESRRRIAAAGVATVSDVRAAGRPLVGFSAAMAARERALKRFMYAELYHSPSQLAVAAAARGVLSRLLDLYLRDPRRMPPDWVAGLPAEEPWRTRHVADFVAGMTDRYAIARHEELIGPAGMPPGF